MNYDDVLTVSMMSFNQLLYKNIVIKNKVLIEVNSD